MSDAPRPLRIFMVATESSGDFLGGRLLMNLHKDGPPVTAFGVGGPEMSAQGFQTVFQVKDFNVMGLAEVLSKLPKLRAMFSELVAQAKAQKPDLVVLIDAPDFNLRMAKALRPLQIPIMYYVSPQVWAWRKSRAAKIARLVDHMMVLFPFETQIYESFNLPTTFVGHPLVDEVKVSQSKEAFFQEHGFDPQRPLVCLAPGSRKKEIEKLLPTLIEVADARSDRYQFAIPLAPALQGTESEKMLARHQVRVLPSLFRPLTAHADASVVASGTATLETGLLGTPMIMGYKLNSLTYQMAKRLVDLPYVCLVNIVLGQMVVPELIQNEFNPGNILPLLDQLAQPSEARTKMLTAFEKLPEALGGGGSSARAAQCILEFMKS